ncbi:MAG: hypothetical protein M9924_10555 [Rhizobiaceae bacterium]|nr:hypothetical protein [Rhizobiaceae bacterium]
MPRLALSVLLILVGVVSLSLKVNADGRASDRMMYPDQNDIVALLEHNSFAVQFAPPNTDPQWVTGTRGACRVQIANVSPQGWHRNIVEWASKDRTLIYSAGGSLEPKQPLLGPMAHHYLNRLKRYVGIGAPAVRVRAILFDKGCEPMPISQDELAALSG